MSAILQLNKLSFRYHKDAKWLFRNLSFTFLPESITVLTGPNGSGKSSLLYSICRVIPNLFNGMFLGQVLYDGKDLAKYSLPQISMWISLLLQEPDHQIIFPVVEQELAFGAENLCIPAASIRSKITEALSMLGLEKLRHAKTHELSYGQKKLISLASLLIKDSPILLLDEPSAGMDSHSMQTIKRILREMAANGKIIIYADHSQEMIEMATQQIILPFGDETGTYDAIQA